MCSFVFSSETFDDGTVLYYVDVEDGDTGEILVSSEYGYDRLEDAEVFARDIFVPVYGDLCKWVYRCVSTDDFIQT